MVNVLNAGTDEEAAAGAPPPGQQLKPANCHGRQGAEIHSSTTSNFRRCMKKHGKR
jgi:hypothetical protein